MNNIEVISTKDYRLIRETTELGSILYYIEIRLRNRLGEETWVPTDEELRPSHINHKYGFGETTELPIQVIWELMEEHSKVATK